MLDVYIVVDKSYLDTDFINEKTGPFDYFTAKTEIQAKKYFKENYKDKKNWTYVKMEMYQLNHEITANRKRLEDLSREIGITIQLIDKLNDIRLDIIDSKSKK